MRILKSSKVERKLVFGIQNSKKIEKYITIARNEKFLLKNILKTRILREK
jgi:hypothetical protein